jgi:hypothetical protein
VGPLRSSAGVPRAPATFDAWRSQWISSEWGCGAVLALEVLAHSMVRSGLLSRTLPGVHEPVVCHRLGQMWRRRVLRGAHCCEFQRLDSGPIRKLCAYSPSSYGCSRGARADLSSRWIVAARVRACSWGTEALVVFLPDSRIRDRVLPSRHISGHLL